MKGKVPKIDAGYWNHVPDRKLIREPIFNFEVDEETVVTFDILIDKFGNVVDVNINWRLSQASWNYTLIRSVKAVFKMKFESLRRVISEEKDVEPQQGQIGFIFYDLNLYD